MAHILTCTPSLPADFPHRATVVNALRTLLRHPLWQAYNCGALGLEVAETILKSVAFTTVTNQDESITADTRISLLLAFETAINGPCRL